MVKQVIVVRSDLRNSEGHKIRTGKIAAQVAHASMKVFFDRMKIWRNVQHVGQNPNILHPCFDQPLYSYWEGEVRMTGPMYEWFTGKFTKVVLKVDSEKELLEIYEKAKQEGIVCSLIQDAGLTEFSEPTFTCVGIGPDNEEVINKITGHLSLF